MSKYRIIQSDVIRTKQLKIFLRFRQLVTEVMFKKQSINFRFSKADVLLSELQSLGKSSNESILCLLLEIYCLSKATEHVMN